MVVNCQNLQQQKRVTITTPFAVLYKPKEAKMIPDEYKNYKHVEPAEASKSYFHQYPAELWSFRHYFENTHNNIRKYKKYNQIVDDFCKDLDWLLDQNSTPSDLKAHLRSLKSEKLPNKSALKAEYALPRKVNIVNNKNTFNIIGNNNQVQNIRVGDNIESSAGIKRKLDNDHENGNSSKKPEIEKSNSLLQKWDSFLNNKETFHPYSPEYHRVIRSGKSVSPKPFLDEILYNQHVGEHSHLQFNS